MSSTITTTTTSLSVLADYEVHHSGEENVPTVNHSQPQPGHPDWPTHHRRIPAYRPANREMDLTQRPAGNGHPAEFAFIQVMLHGVWLNAVGGEW
ncbi:uncharacterized protein N7477_009127 [Penicillium maclennaniae]|uniref:uncharacterized protein n=1 Tax=Penicillium maclennaniae TaxID=1343394 RepID=UPI0025426946|nr:uncharacterized protein N7477_009127 [Penicillium maclennaniae]KAJ5661511.1 hypothetical protein N7477_009127 [Penicillium maclennaniae]